MSGPRASDIDRAIGGGTPPRHLLVVTYHFPPIQSAGVYRMVGMVKYLRAHGWQISVLTVRRSTHEGSDDASLNLIPDGIEVIRTDSIEPAARVLRAAGVRGEASAPAEKSEYSPGAGDGRQPLRKSLLRRALSRPARGLLYLLSYPDHQVGWVPRVATEVMAFVRRHPGAIVLSSTPPHSTQIGVRLARAFSRFGWVADFRDPWTAPLRQPKNRANLALQRALERWVLSGCDRVIANTAGNRKELLASFPRLDAARVQLVPNAFDTETLPAPAAPDDPALACDMAYFGEVYPGMLDAYFEAVRLLVAEDANRAPRLHVFGRVGVDDVQRVQRSRLSPYIVFMGTVSYARSLSLMRSARSLLLLLPDGESLATCVPSKLYPYLFSGRPVLALVPPGDAARIVEETDSGAVVAPGEPRATAEGILAFVERVRRGELPRSSSGDARVTAYSMDRVASRVDQILREVSPRG